MFYSGHHLGKEPLEGLTHITSTHAWRHRHGNDIGNAKAAHKGFDFINAAIDITNNPCLRHLLTMATKALPAFFKDCLLYTSDAADD